jgi:hypothetical protein
MAISSPQPHTDPPPGASSQSGSAGPAITLVALTITAISSLVGAAITTWPTTWRFAIACTAASLPLATVLAAYLLLR